MNESIKQLPSSAWQPGESANPGGRPKWLKEFRDLAKENVPAALTKLMEFVNGKVKNGDTEEKVPLRLQFQAVQELLDRTLGKAVQTTNVGIGLEPPGPATETDRLLSDYELARRVAFALEGGMRAKSQLEEIGVSVQAGGSNGQ